MLKYNLTSYIKGTKMKKMLLAIILLGSTMLMAETSENRQTTMQSLEKSMALIQKGFLYNNRDGIKEGVASLREELKNINSFVIENDKNTKFDAKKYADTQTKVLEQLSSKILDGFDAGHKESVLSDYQQMLNGCVTCHALVRRW